MAEWIRAHAPKTCAFSPALRTRQTTETLGLPFDTDKRLGPSADVSDFLTAVGWPDDGHDAEPCIKVLVVGHQPALGRLASLLLAGQEAEWTIKKGAVSWFSNRVRLGEAQTTLRAVIPAEFGQ